VNLDSALAYAQRHELHALIVASALDILGEWYGAGYDAAAPHALYSGTKSFWGIAAMHAANDGILRLDEHVCETIEEWADDARKAQMTIRQLLDLTSGYGFGGLGAGVPIASKAIATPLRDDPGTIFTYGGVPLQVFGEVLRRKLRSHATSPHAYLRERILAPAGVQIADWRTLPDGTHTLPTGAFIDARAWLAYGRMLLANSARADVRECTSGSAVNPRYGLGFWLDPLADATGIFYASGASGQALYIIPRERCVVVHFAKSNSWKHDAFLKALLGIAARTKRKPSDG